MAFSLAALWLALSRPELFPSWPVLAVAASRKISQWPPRLGIGIEFKAEDARELVRLIKHYKLPAKVNLIPFNPWPGAPYDCSTPERIRRFSEIVFEAGISAPVRTPRGRDIDAACGQLKTSAEKKSRAELDRAFDDFHSTKEGGTGLGLSIVRRLVLDLGGALRLETAPGAGTRAIVELPVGPGSGAAGGRER